MDLLSDRALNRATLERQLLLRRWSMEAGAAVAHLVGLQAQEPLDPYLALWSRLDPFDPQDLGRRLEDRSLVRMVVMRGTIHLVTAEDGLALRPIMQPVLDAELARHAEFGPKLRDVDLGPILAVAERVLAAQPMTGRQLRAAMAERFPAHDPAALAYACRCRLALVQLPPRGVWGETSAVVVTPLTAWVGRPLAPEPDIDQVVLRYLGAFGPATVADVAAWSRLTGLRQVLERLRPQLRSFRDERGRELFDLPDAPRPDEETPAPVRFLPEYDNLLLSHADRSRFGTDEERRVAGAAGPVKGTVLVDGRVRAVWHAEVDRRRDRCLLVVEHHPLSTGVRSQVEAEAERVARFRQPGAAGHEVRLRAVEASTARRT
jgi:hypothetical protein